MSGINPETGVPRTAEAAEYKFPFDWGLAKLVANGVAISFRERDALAAGIPFPPRDKVIRKLQRHLPPPPATEAKCYSATGLLLDTDPVNNAIAFHKVTHMSPKKMLHAVDKKLFEVPYTKKECKRMMRTFDCGSCHAGDMKRLPFKGSTMTPSKYNGNDVTVFMDTCGELPATCVRSGFKYFAAFLSRRSRRSWVIFYKHGKSHYLVLRKFFENYHAEYRQYPTKLIFDNDGKQISNKVSTECSDHGVATGTCGPGGEEGNVAETLIQAIERRARKYMADAPHLGEGMYSEAVRFGNYMRNREPNQQNFRHQSPMQIEKRVAPRT
jgi:hypothetical protein